MQIHKQIKREEGKRKGDCEGSPYTSFKASILFYASNLLHRDAGSSSVGGSGGFAHLRKKGGRQSSRAHHGHRVPLILRARRGKGDIHLGSASVLRPRGTGDAIVGFVKFTVQRLRAGWSALGPSGTLTSFKLMGFARRRSFLVLGERHRMIGRVGTRLRKVGRLIQIEAYWR